ncbi:hypothetical protein [Sunxiuqinia dokdonensis]|jgi:hypothetical protein|uniref:Uncharacterized protein n=1 Tax=Sunxiuqinia dokdonensis TaxID=1409788 RepID=A0A0L8VF59_9BACT|nr:hypothetical protein [Sunxiuqinia dokdonensis]KOH47110.1 hypothetical protein NC99_00760 [Sunxiuqinia dokdonensis]
MDSIIIKPKDKREFNFFVELANRLGVEIKTTGDYLDEELLNDMEKNKETPYIEKEEVLKTIQNILNEDQAGYTK